MTDSDFNTPPWILDLVRALDYRGIGLDPCSNSHSMVYPRHSYGIHSNGLIHSWRNFGLVFMNPPHSTSPNNIEPWMEKAYREFIETPSDYDDHSTDSFIGLVPAKTDTAWFHDYVTHFSARCFLRGRPKFWHKGEETKGPGKFPSMLLYHGSRIGCFCSIFEPYGWIV